MTERSKIREHAKVVGADNVPVGTVDGVEGDHITLKRTDPAEGHHFFIPLSLVADADDRSVWLSVSADVAIEFAEEEGSASAG